MEGERELIYLVENVVEEIKTIDYSNIPKLGMVRAR